MVWYAGVLLKPLLKYLRELLKRLEAIASASGPSTGGDIH